MLAKPAHSSYVRQAGTLPEGFTRMNGWQQLRPSMQDGYESAHEDTRFDLWVGADHAYALNETDPGCV
jgi:hypothetical protein